MYTAVSMGATYTAVSMGAIYSCMGVLYSCKYGCYLQL